VAFFNPQIFLPVRLPVRYTQTGVRTQTGLSYWVKFPEVCFVTTLLFYNRKRRHSSLGNKSPMEFENTMAVP